TIIKDKLKKKQSDLNTTAKKISKLEKELSSKYGELLDKKFEGVTFDEWIDNKTDVKLYSKIQINLNELTTNLTKTRTSLSEMKTEKETLSERKYKEQVFSGKFNTYLRELGLKPLKESRYVDLYRINSFPFQGVELHKTVMAYHFAFNAIISETESIHRLPFLLDAVLKEDIDETNLDSILRFIGRNIPKDTQTFISISEHKKKNIENEINKNPKKTKPFEAIKVNEVNEMYFSNRANVIYIGHGSEERSFFTKIYRI
ncbi:hypothetical protein EAY71_20810, partial [Vibrio anguillarum]